MKHREKQREVPEIEYSRINFRRVKDKDAIKLDFTAVTKGTGCIHLYYAGKFVKTIRLNLTRDMEMVNRG